mmetsp:Transcript_5679/g.13153  ORF Transcript_5679/g.13153 Transcript_5679/m.13153 type:complete len:284 (-) Transcript_5679:1210-2061(-)
MVQHRFCCRHHRDAGHHRVPLREVRRAQGDVWAAHARGARHHRHRLHPRGVGLHRVPLHHRPRPRFLRRLPGMVQPALQQEDRRRRQRDRGRVGQPRRRHHQSRDAFRDAWFPQRDRRERRPLVAAVLHRAAVPAHSRRPLRTLWPRPARRQLWRTRELWRQAEDQLEDRHLPRRLEPQRMDPRHYLRLLLWRRAHHDQRGRPLLLHLPRRFATASRRVRRVLRPDEHLRALVGWHHLGRVQRQVRDARPPLGDVDRPGHRGDLLRRHGPVDEGLRVSGRRSG